MLERKRLKGRSLHYEIAKFYSEEHKNCLQKRWDHNKAASDWETAVYMDEN
jgi:hypothetical protein